MSLVRMSHQVVKKFDTSRLVRKFDREVKKSLFRWGAGVRTSAIKSIRYSKKRQSVPGEPPKTHIRKRAGSLRHIRFQVGKRDVVVHTIARGTGNAPRALELGGQTTMRRTVRSGRHRMVRSFRVRVAKRPFMVPASDKINRKDRIRGFVRVVLE